MEITGKIKVLNETQNIGDNGFRKREVVITTEEPANAGIFQIKNKEQYIEDISYNYNRNESNLQYLNIADWNGVRSYNTIEALFDTLQEENSINSFWKWFVIFAFLFLILEMLVLKFYKQ